MSVEAAAQRKPTVFENNMARTIALCAKACADAAVNPAFKDISFFQNTITVADVYGNTFVLTCETVR